MPPYFILNIPILTTYFRLFNVAQVEMETNTLELSHHSSCRSIMIFELIPGLLLEWNGRQLLSEAPPPSHTDTKSSDPFRARAFVPCHNSPSPDHNSPPYFNTLLVFLCPFSWVFVVMSVYCMIVHVKAMANIEYEVNKCKSKIASKVLV